MQKIIIILYSRSLRGEKRYDVCSIGRLVEIKEKGDMYYKAKGDITWH